MNKLNLSLQPYKGTRDFYPKDFAIQKHLFDIYREVCLSYGYEEYNGPTLESFELYAAKTGEEIVNNELYSFTDRGDRKVAIRPEMTPTVARMIAARIQELPKPIRWFSIANFMRNEAPQRGRLREFWQLNLDIFGVEKLDAEIEMMQISRDIFVKLGATPEMYECRVNNRKLLNAVFSSMGLKEENRQIYKVSKAIDKKDKISQEDFEKMLSDAECNSKQIDALTKYLSSSIDDISSFVDNNEIGFQDLMTFFELMSLDSRNNFVKFSPGLMRGFDYYTGMVFEFFDIDETNKRSLFGGGRYDDLISILNGQNLAAVGIAPGEVPMLDFMEVHNLLPKFITNTNILVTIIDDAAKGYALDIADKLRLLGYKVMTYIADGKLDKQLKFASQRGIKYVVIAGDLEMSKNTFKIKNMDERSEKEIKIEDLENLQL